METEFVIPLSSGVKLAGLLNTPEGDGPHPFVLLLHGFTGWKEEDHLSSLAVGLASTGIAALRFDAPGSGESEGSFATDYRLTNYLTSIVEVLNYLHQELPVEPSRVGIWGHSMGGFAALATAVRHGDRLRAVCGSQPSMGKGNVSRKSEAEWRTTGWSTFSNSRFPKIELPYEFYLDRQQYDVVEMIAGLNMPLLLIGGTHDVLVPASDVSCIFAAAPEPKTYREFATDHDYKNHPEVLQEINNVTVEFFHRTLMQPAKR